MTYDIVHQLYFIKKEKKKHNSSQLPHLRCNAGNSQAVQWLEFGIFTPMARGSIPGWGTKVLQTVLSDLNK